MHLSKYDNKKLFNIKNKLKKYVIKNMCNIQ